jgi:carbamoyl-phosphate synthase small subunit
MGNDIFALAMGADTYKMKSGHRSANQPAMDCLETKRCYVTFQNHGYAVDPASLSQTDLQLWYTNMNDKTVEGIKHTKTKASGVQFHPEHLPGPIDAKYIFDQFIELMKSGGR